MYVLKNGKTYTIGFTIQQLGIHSNVMILSNPYDTQIRHHISRICDHFEASHM